MSEYTREEILKLIEENGGPEGLDLSGKDLSGIDLGREAIEAELGKVREIAPHKTPLWLKHMQRMNLRSANLQGAILTHADLRGADFMDANLQGADLESAKLQEARLGRAHLQKANLKRANLQRANLYAANLEGANLTRVNLQSANLIQANLRKADLYAAELQGASLWKAQLAGANLCLTNFLNTQITAQSIGNTTLQENEDEYEEYFEHGDPRVKLRYKAQHLRERHREAKEIYLALKNNFVSTGRYDDASWAYIKERRMEKKCNAPWRARRFYGESQLGDSGESGLPASHPRVLWFYTRHTLKWLADWFVELLCDYGESIWRVLAWMLLVILGFAAYYQVSHAVVTSSQDAATSLWDHLIFSLGAFTTLQPARLQAARPGVELLTTIQAIIGISLAGLLGFVAGNRIRRS